MFNIFTSCFGRRKEFNLKEKLKILDEIVSDSDHREFVSAGVSAGISAAFGAPIGGVLFSMEEACSFWSRKTAWRCFIAASLSTYTIQLLNRRWAAAPAPWVAHPTSSRHWPAGKESMIARLQLGCCAESYAVS